MENPTFRAVIRSTDIRAGVPHPVYSRAPRPGSARIRPSLTRAGAPIRMAMLRAEIPIRQAILRGAALILAGLACAASAAEEGSAWAYSADLSLNTSATGAGIASEVTGFPLLVRLTSANFDFGQARSDGRDIRFVKSDGTPLAYEIERWDAALRSAEIWVRLDTLRGNTAAQSIRMRWGNPAAPDSSRPGSVFGAADGFAAVWHLGGSGSSPRPNAAGGNPAVPGNYDGDEGTAGVIGGADSLDGTAAGDYLDVGDGYSGLAASMTYTVWAYPTAAKAWSHLLDLGNGENADNIVLGRWDTTSGLSFHNWAGAAHYRVNAPGQMLLNQWQMLGVTVSGRNVVLYRDGVPVLADTLGEALTAVNRALCFLGRTNSASRGQYYQGKLDEAEIASTARSADWMKLAYLNQKPGQSIPVLVRSSPCAARFAVPRDTTLPEAGLLALRATAECASSLAWSYVSGPAVRILDPERTDLSMILPRVSGDTELILRFSAAYADSERSADVRVRVTEAVPDPIFSLPADTGWNGIEAMAYRPAIANLAALRAAPDTVLRWNWTFTGTVVDTGWLPDGVLLRRAEAGELGIRLCLDNGGAPACRERKLRIGLVGGTTGLAPLAPRPAATLRTGRDVLGRPAWERPWRKVFRVDRR